MDNTQKNSIAILSDGTITVDAVNPVAPTPSVSYERIDDQTVHVVETVIYTTDDKISDIVGAIKSFQQRKIDQAKDSSLMPEDVDGFITKYTNELKGASAVGVTDADAAMKDLGIQ